MKYDIIGDIHGHADELKALLEKLCYQHDGVCYRHPERQAIFLGDFIDRGPQQREVIQTVMPMVKSGAAQSVMANHEFNALAFNTPHPDKPGEWLRPHNKKNTDQHSRFLEEYLDAGHDNELKEALTWFCSLPLWLDLGELRVVHACWHEPSIQALAGQLGPHNTLTPELLVKASQKGSAEFNAVEILLKGWERTLPNGLSFKDKDQNVRHEIRTKWWLNGRVSLREASVVQDLVHLLPEGEMLEEDALPGYPVGAPPVFIGHYWLQGEPAPLSANVTCLDYSVAKNGKLVAYCWDGEKELDASKYVFVF